MSNTTATTVLLHKFYNLFTCTKHGSLFSEHSFFLHFYKPNNQNAVVSALSPLIILLLRVEIKLLLILLMEKNYYGRSKREKQ